MEDPKQYPDEIPTTTGISLVEQFKARRLYRRSAYNIGKEIIFRGPKMSFNIPLHNGLGPLILRYLTRNGDSVFITNGNTDEHSSYGFIKTCSVRFALMLRKRGFRNGDVLILCTESLSTNIAVLPLIACFYLGVVACLVSNDCSNANVNLIVTYMKPKLIFCDANKKYAFTKACRDALISADVYVLNSREFEMDFSWTRPSKKEHDFKPNPVNPIQEHAFILFTNDIDGKLKGMPHTHYAYFQAVSNIMLQRRITRAGVILSYAAMDTIPYMFLFLHCILLKVTKVCAVWNGPLHCLEVIKKYRVTGLLIDKARLRAVANHPQIRNFIERRQIRFVGCMNDYNTKEQMNFFRLKFRRAHVLSVYTVPEFPSPLAWFDRINHYYLCKRKGNSVGKLCPSVKLKIIDPKTNVSLGPNKEGLLLFKSSLVNVKSIMCFSDQRNTFDEGGWFRNGDIGYIDEDECLFVTENIKKTIIYNSVPISIVALESLIFKHPQVQDCVVMGFPHWDFGTVPMVFVAPIQGHNITPADIMQFVRENGSENEELYGGVKIVENIPRLNNGNLDLVDLRNQLDEYVPSISCKCSD